MNKNDKTHWQTKKLGEVCDILDNKRKPITKRNRTTGEYPYYGATGILDYVGDYIFDEKLILIGEDGAKWESGEHTAFIADGKYWVNNHAHVIRPHRNIILDNWIVFYFYLTDLTKHTTGLTVPKLNQANLRNIEIPLPPLPEQHRIVKILDEVFADVAKAKENAEKNLKNAKELFESYLQSVFANPGKNWEEKKLGEAYDVRDGTHDSPKYQKEGYALITSKNLKRDELDYQKIKYISEKDYKKINERSKVHKGDILFAMIGTIGNPVVIKIEPDFAIKNVALFKIPKDQNSYFLKYFLDSKFVIDKMMREAKGTTQKFVGLGYLRNFKIQLPKLDEQKSIVSKLDALSAETKKLETIYQQKLTDLEELKKSVLKRAFNDDL